MQPNTHRTPDQNAELGGKDVDQDAFEPGVSFTDEPSEQGETGELPSWLQNFAGAAGEPGNSGKSTAAAEESGTSKSRDESSRSSALQTQPPVVAPQSSSAEEPSGQFGQIPNSGDASFFSEDDLPEWLRALSTDGESSAGAASVVAVSTESVTPNGAINVPPVTRAWVTASDQPEVSSGANLLSSLVHVIDNHPEAVAVESNLSAPASPPSVKAAAQPKAAQVASEQAATATATATTTNDAGRWSRTRILAIAAIFITLLFVILLVSGN